MPTTRKKETMAKADGVSPLDHPNTEQVILHDYQPETTPGKYDDYITAMLDADRKIEEDDPDGYANGRRKAATVISNSRINDKGVDVEVEKTKRLFQDSARQHERTAKLVKTTPQGDGLVALDFILAPKQHRPRKPATDTATSSTQDIPEEATTAA